MVHLVSPTGRPIRGVDRWGCGAFGAPRGGRPHYGVDFEAAPGQPVVAPCDAVVVRMAPPYPDGSYGGLLLRAGLVEIKLFYLRPTVMTGERVTQGQQIGVAEDLRLKYPEITPHVHMEVTLRADGGYLRKEDAVYVAPAILLDDGTA